MLPARWIISRSAMASWLDMPVEGKVDSHSAEYTNTSSAASAEGTFVGRAGGEDRWEVGEIVAFSYISWDKTVSSVSSLA